MSEGPIKEEREAWRPPVVSTSSSSRVCARATGGRALCGRRKVSMVSRISDATCADCLAAARADAGGAE
jgi:hypothetical protein